MNCFLARDVTLRTAQYQPRGAASCGLLESDVGAQPCASSKPNQHAQAEPVDLSVLDLGYPGLSNAKALGCLDLRQGGLAQPFIDRGEELGAHFKLGGLFCREQVVKYRLCHHGHPICLSRALARSMSRLAVAWVFFWNACRT